MSNDKDYYAKWSDAELIQYGRTVIRTMKANGYGGIVWDEVLDRFSKSAPSAERDHIIEECAQAAEHVSPRHTECGNKIARAIRALQSARSASVDRS